MFEFNEDRPARKWGGRAAAVIFSVLVLYWAVTNIGPFSLFTMAGVVILLVYVFDVPQLIFTFIDAARNKVDGVEHEGRHEWYGFRGTRLRLFFDDSGTPWIAVKEFADALQIDDPAETFRTYQPSEFASQAFAEGEECLSETGLRRFLKYSRHPEAQAFRVWFDREVLFPRRRRKEILQGDPPGPPAKS